MREAERIADQLRRAMEGDAWHGPNLRELLANLSESQASARTVANGHSIWGLTLHLTSWARMARRRIEVREHIEMPEAENFPEPQGDWETAREELFRETELLRRKIAELADEELSEFFYVLLHGSVQHHLYHAGQIALLRKLV